MEDLKEISYWDMPDCIQVLDRHDAYCMTQEPDNTRENIKYFVDEHNKLVDAFNELKSIVLPNVS